MKGNGHSPNTPKLTKEYTLSLKHEPLKDPVVARFKALSELDAIITFMNILTKDDNETSPSMRMEMIARMVITTDS